MVSPSPARGISLAESSIVVAIIGVIASIALPAFNAASKTQGLIAAAADVRTSLYRTRILAIMGNQDCRLRVTSPVTYLIECETPGWVTRSFHQLRSGFTITANNEPEFHPLGNVAPMATITVWDERGRYRKIVTSRGGRIRTE